MITVTGSFFTPRLWRVKHDPEISRLWRPTLPEVFRLDPEHQIAMTQAIQLFIMGLNSSIPASRLWKMFTGARAFTNGTGFDEPGEPRANFFINKDIYEPLPVLDEPRLCGGATVAEVGRDGNKVYIDYIDLTKPLPALTDVRPWQKFCCLNSVDAHHCSRFPQGDMDDGVHYYDVIMPILGKFPLWIDSSMLVPVDPMGGIPNPYLIP